MTNNKSALTSRRRSGSGSAQFPPGARHSTPTLLLSCGRGAGPVRLPRLLLGPGSGLIVGQAVQATGIQADSQGSSQVPSAHVRRLLTTGHAPIMRRQLRPPRTIGSSGHSCPLLSDLWAAGVQKPFTRIFLRLVNRLVRAAGPLWGSRRTDLAWLSLRYGVGIGADPWRGSYVPWPRFREATISSTVRSFCHCSRSRV